MTPTDFDGFVYLITNIATGKAYVGRKYIWVERKGKARKESNWRSYFGSSKDLLADVALLGEAAFKREILLWCPSKFQTNFSEVEEQFKREVLTAKLPDGTPAFYNRNIMSRYYARTLESYQNPVTRAKMSASQKAKAPASDETRAKISKAMAGRSLDPNHKQRISASLTGKGKSDDHRAKLSLARKQELVEKGPRAHTPESRAKIGRANSRISDADKATLRDRVDAGETLETIAIVFGVSREAVRRAVKAEGIDYKHPRYRR